LLRNCVSASPQSIAEAQTKKNSKTGIADLQNWNSVTSATISQIQIRIRWDPNLFA
jgi:hypothetical protein